MSNWSSDQTKIPPLVASRTARMERAGKAQSHVLKVHRILARALKVARRREKIARNVAELVDPPMVTEVERDDLSALEAKRS